MNTNSAIFTSTVVQNSGLTVAELTALSTNIAAQYLNQSNNSTLRTQVPTIPSDQRIAKDK